MTPIRPSPAPERGRGSGDEAPGRSALPEELTAVLWRMRLPYVRAAAPEVLATARSQRWDPAEVLRVLLVEEVAGRDAATRPAAQGRRLPRGQDLRHLGVKPLV